MVLKNVKSELGSSFKQIEKYASARQMIIVENKDIVKACRESITASRAANMALPGNQEEKLERAQEKAEKAGKILKRLQKRMKGDFGRFWRQELNTFLINSEQEVVEAFSFLAVIKQEEIPPLSIPFWTQNPDSYVKRKTTVKVSEIAYVMGLLDCIGELKRAIVDALSRTDREVAEKIFTIMQELFKELEPFTEFSNLREGGYAGLKPKIDSAGYAIRDTKEMLK